jgi:hypothetical protein
MVQRLLRQLKSLSLFDRQTFVKALFAAVGDKVRLVGLLVDVLEGAHRPLEFLGFVKLDNYSTLLTFVFVVNLDSSTW